MAKNRQELLHLCNQPEDKLLLAKVLDQADFSFKRKENVFTDFIDPKRLGTFITILPKISGVHSLFYGGMEGAERKLLGFCPEFREIGPEDFPIYALMITRNIKFSAKLSHRDYLGSILGLGISRNKVGDILLLPEYTIVFIKEEIAEYICANLTRVGKTKVEVRKAELECIKLPEQEVELEQRTVSSLRFDAVLGAAFHLARAKAQDMILAERAFINWAVCTDVSQSIKEGDMLSLRGTGRAKLLEVTGKTKKDRIGILLQRYR